MLINFSVTGFRNFENELNFDFRSDADYDFNLECVKDGVVNTAIIYGQNGSGKSNLGLAIEDINSFLFNENITTKHKNLFLNGNIDKDKEIVIFYYEFSFQKNVIYLTYHKNKNAQLVYEELKINEELIYKFDHIKNEMIEENLEKINANTLNFSTFNYNRLNDTRSSILGYIVNNSAVTKSITDLMSFVAGMFIMNGTDLTSDRVLNNIVKEDLVDKFNLFLKEFNIKEQIVKVTTSSGEEILGIKLKNKTIPFADTASKGTKALAFFFYLYKSAEIIDFLYLDEFDAFYHYELSEKLIELLKGIDGLQVVFTTHNTNLLTNNLLRPDCYFVLGNNKITPLNKATRRELDEGHNLERLYIGGEFND